MAEEKLDLLKGTLDLLVLQILSSMGPTHGYGIARRLEQISGDELAMNEGTIYASLVRLQHRRLIKTAWGTSDNNRRAKYYSLTRAGEKALTAEAANWERLTSVIDRVLATSEGGEQMMIREIQETLSRLASVLRRRTLDQEFNEEFDTHIDLLTEKNESRDMPHDEARRQAILQMGGLNATRDLQREARELPAADRFLDLLRGFTRDLIHAARSLARARAFTFVCVVSLGIGMAPVIAVPYGVRILTMTPPGVRAEGLVELVLTPVGPRGDSDEWSYPDFVDLRNADTGIEMTGWATGRTEATIRTPGAEKSETVRSMFVSSNYFRTFGVALARGPGFDAAVDEPLKADPVVILGYWFWRNRLNSDPDIVGKTLTLDGIPHVVAGIAPDQFSGHMVFDSDARLFLPLERHPSLRADKSLRFSRDKDWNLHVHGRLSPGVSIAQANAAVSALTSRLAKQYPATNEFKVGAVQAYDAVGHDGRAELFRIKSALLALTGLVLLVVCLNISGMMQVRSAMRGRELSVRQAIGASRRRLVQYLLSEAIILSGLGSVLAAGVLFGIPAVMAWLSGNPLSPQVEEMLRPDLFMIAICAGLCVAASLMFGLLPATRFSRPVIISALKDDAGGGGLRVGRVHRLTAALQVGIAVPLLVISATFVERVRATAIADLGFASKVVYAAPLKLAAVTDQSAGFRIRSVQDNLEKASGVASVTVADGLPLDFQNRFVRVSLEAHGSAAPKFLVHVTRVGDGYLDTMGIPLLGGRGITADDGAGTENVTVISNTLAGQLFPNSEPGEVIGKRLTFALSSRTQQVIVDSPAVTIVGVTGDFVGSQMSTERAQLLLPLAQHPVPSVLLIARSVSGEQPLKLTAAFANALRVLDPDFKPASVITGDQLRRRSMLFFLNASAATGGIGGVILVLAALGIYGVVGLMVATRTREIAVRVALGASRRRVLGMILFDVVKLVVPGVAGGLVIALAVIRIMISSGGNMRIPLSDLESLAYVVGAAIAMLVALLASLAPARRAASVAAMVAMRAE